MRALLSTSVTLLAIYSASPALAQNNTGEVSNPAEDAPDPRDRAKHGLDEIVITAQRVEGISQRTPLALDVVQPDELIRQNVVRAEDLSRTAPALSANSSGGPITVFFLRGVGNATLNSYSDPAIAFNYDGVYIGRPTSTSGAFYDLQRVEVLKGPQGTLYGRNATAGAINVIPNRPKLGELSGNAVLGYGNYNWWSGQGAFNLPIGENSAIRLAGTFSNHDGFQKDGTGKQSEYGARLQFYTEMGDVDLRIAGDYSHQGGNGSSGYYMGKVDPTFGPNGFAGYAFTPSGFSPNEGVHTAASEAYLAGRFNTTLGRAGATLSSYPYNDNDYWGVTAELNWETAAGMLTIQPAYREASLDYQFTNTMRAANVQEKDKQISVEARWAGNFGESVDYLVGAMYFDEDISATSSYNQLTLDPFQDYTTATESYAGFGQITVRPVEKLSLTAGLRYTSDKKRFDGSSVVYLPFCGNPAPPQDFCPDLPFTPLVGTAAELEDFYTSRGIPVTPVPLYVLPGFVEGTPFVLKAPILINSSRQDDKFTYRLAAQYDLTDRNMVYASFETGYHAGGFSFARGLDSYEPETINAYTLGTKNRFFDSTLQVNVEAFIWKYKNQQYSQFGYDLGTPPSTVLLTRNIGDATIKGVEADIDWQATGTTLLSANVQFLDTKYDSFTYFVPNQGLPPITTCAYTPTMQDTSAGTVSVFAIDCSGKPAFNSPKWSINLNGEQTIPLSTVDITLQAGTRYRSSSWTSADYPTWTKAKWNFVSNASVTISDPEESWFVTAYVLNIEDSRRLTGATNNSAGALPVAGVEQPRTYGIRIGGKF